MIKQKAARVCTYWRSTEKPKVIDWIVFAILAAVCFLSFLYGDILITTSQGINFWSVLLRGKIMNFYQINYHQFFGMPADYSSSYDFPIYFIFGIWDFPLWVIRHFWNIITLNCIPALIWTKLILMPFLAGTAICIYKICRQMKMTSGDAKWAVYLFLTSAFVFSPVFILNQYDIISVCFAMFGILELLRGKKIGFILLFAVANSLKLFSIFIFVPLILLYEKKVWKIAVEMAGGLSLLAFCKLIFHNAPMYKASTSDFSGGMANRLWSNGIPSCEASASIFIILLALICVFCYTRKNMSEEMRNRYTIIAPFMAYASFFSFVHFFPYWIVLLAPFISIMMLQNKHCLKANLLVDSVLSLSYMSMVTITFSWCYSSGVIDFLKIIPTLFGRVDASKRVYGNSASFLAQYGINGNVMPVISAAFVACLIALTAMNFPRERKPAAEIGEERVERSIVWLRLFTLVPFVFLMLFCYYWLK